MRILIINGPNLNLLGQREPAIYGSEGFDAYLNTLKSRFAATEIDYFQSNVEGEIINALHSAIGKFDGIVLNAGAYTHTSIAIADAIKAIEVPVVEVHISNVTNRESFRHSSFLTPVCKGCIFGFGLKGYDLAIQSFLA